MSALKTHVRYIWIPILILAILIPAGYVYVDWSKSGKGAGLYSRQWVPEAIFAYWNPDDFYKSVNTVVGEFSGEQCVACHQSVTPGVVNDWRKSRHSHPPKGQAVVYCSSCHGNNHQALHLPTPKVCGGCHTVQHGQFEDEKRYGFPSHALAMERALDAKHFVDKPKAEVTACLQCHSVAEKCDSCHTRHRFNAAEARRPEACTTCHSGPPHPDDDTYFHSKHGQLYLAQGESWDWSKPLKKGNYLAPTCAYCHMGEGKHQVADKSIWQFGLKQVNPLSSGNEVKRDQWVKLCSDCHAADWARNQLRQMDQERKRAWGDLYQAEDILKGLRSDHLLQPSAKQRPPYPGDSPDQLWPREHIGYLDGQASAFYNVSIIERNYFDMWYFDNLAAYKGAAHGDAARVTEGHANMAQRLRTIKQEADVFRLRDKTTPKNTDHDSIMKKIWLKGEYTEFNREHN